MSEKPALRHGGLTAAQRRKRRKVRNYYRRMTLRNLRRWWRERCAYCGRRPFWSESMILAPGTGRFHDACHAAWRFRMVAVERLRVLDVVADVWQVASRDVQTVMGLRAREEGAETANAENAAWRVFYDLEKRRAAANDGSSSALT